MPEQHNAGRDAQEQATAYNSVFAPTKLQLDDGTTIDVPPHPNLRMFDDDALAELEKLEFDLESYDRHPDIYLPPQKAKDNQGNDIDLPAETRPGAVKIPYRKTENNETKLLDPPYTVRVAQIALGEEDYARLRAGKVNGRRGSAADVWRIWSGQSTELDRRGDADPKSAESPDVLADVAAPDSERPVEVPPAADS